MRRSPAGVKRVPFAGRSRRLRIEAADSVLEGLWGALDKRVWRSHLATHRESLLRAAALLQLWKKGYVEPIQPPSDSFR